MPVSQNPAMQNLGLISLPETGGSASATFIIPIAPPNSNIATQSPLNAPAARPALLTFPSSGRIHITKATATTTAAQLVSLLTPLNWTTLAADGTATTTTSASITLTNDPGLYSTNYRSPSTAIPGWANPTFPNAPSTADNAISAGDYVMFQAADGTWYADLVAGVAGSSTITVGLTNGMPSSKKGSLCYFFGIAGDKDPATALKRTQTTFVASSARADWLDNAGGCGIAGTWFDGDPMLVVAANSDNATKINSVLGFYSGR
jgi:hypothetical protein